MNLQDILSVAIASLVVLVIAHFAVVWVVKTMYPPPPPMPMPVLPTPALAVPFTEPPATEQQNVRIPTYEAPVSAEAPREEGERRGPPPAESTSIRGDTGNALSNA